MITGFWLVLLDGVPPGNDHDVEVTFPVDRSLKVTVLPCRTVVELAEKSAAGAV